jgi:hypothetical protein
MRLVEGVVSDEVVGWVVGKLDGGLRVPTTLLYTMAWHHGTSLVVDDIDNVMR